MPDLIDANTRKEPECACRIHQDAYNSTQQFLYVGVVMGKNPAGMFMRALASVCTKCPVCRTARRKQEGLAYSFVKNIEGGFCPFCMAYERVYGRKAHEVVK